MGRSVEPGSYVVRRPTGARGWLLILSCAGAGWVSVDRHRHALAPGGVVLLPPGVPHSYGTDRPAAPWHLWWVHFHMRGRWLRRLAPGTGSTGRIVTDLGPAVLDDAATTFGRLHAAARWPGHGPLPRPAEDDALPALSIAPTGWSMAAPQVESLLLLLLGRDDEGRLDPRLRRALASVAADPGASHSVASLARTATLSPSRLSHVCATELSRPLMQEVRRIRLEHARGLLEETTLPVAQVARASGFVSPFHFSRCFRAEYGVPPSSHRQQPEG